MGSSNLPTLIDLQKTKEILSKVEGKEAIIKNKLNNYLRKNDLYYKEEVYPICLNAVFLNKDNYENLNIIPFTFSNLMSDLIKVMKEDRSLALDLINSDEVYKILKDSLLSIGPEEVKNIFYRLDGIIFENKIKIIEANMNSPGGISTLEKIYKIGSEIYKEEFNEKEEINFNKGSDYILRNFIEIYKKNCHNQELFLVIGKKDDEERSEHKLIEKKLSMDGIPAKTIDYRDEKLKSKNGELYYSGEKVGIIYRRVFPLDYNKDIIKSEIENKVIVLNHPSSYVLASKYLFAVIHKLKDSKLKKYKDFIEEYLPSTFLISDMNKEKLIKNKDQYVVKKVHLNCGEGVYIGKAETTENWKKIIEEIGPNCIVQDYYEQPELEFIDNKSDGIMLRKFDFNLYCLGEKMIMPYIRVNSKGNYKSNNACGSSEALCYIK